MIDLFASEYGWTVDKILDLTAKEVVLIQECIHNRYKRQNDAMEDASKGKGKRSSGKNFDKGQTKERRESQLLDKYIHRTAKKT